MEKDWVIIFLIYVDFREGEQDGVFLSEKNCRELNSLWNDLRNIELNGRSKVFIVINRVKYILDHKISPVLDNRTYAFEVLKGGKENEIKKYKENEGSVQNAKTLIEIFNEIHNQNRDKKIMLVTWDHGSVFGIFKRIEEIKPIDELKSDCKRLDQLLEINKQLKEDKVLNKGFFNQAPFRQPLYSLGNIKFRIKDNPHEFSEFIKSIRPNYVDASIHFKNKEYYLELKMNDNQNLLNGYFTKDKKEIKIEIEEGVPAILTNSELASAIKDGFNKKIEVLLMMNCMMMNVHTCYALCDDVDYLVAPQGSIDEPGYNYRSFINKIMKVGS